jgi:hypothetical protein
LQRRSEAYKSFWIGSVGSAKHIYPAEGLAAFLDYEKGLNIVVNDFEGMFVVGGLSLNIASLVLNKDFA